MIKILISLVACFCLLAMSIQADRISVIKRIICSHSNPLYVTVKTCRFDPIESANISGNFTIDVTLTRPLDNIKVRVEVLSPVFKNFDLSGPNQGMGAQG
jgi:hypothetical protein